MVSLLLIIERITRILVCSGVSAVNSRLCVHSSRGSGWEMPFSTVDTLGQHTERITAHFCYAGDQDIPRVGAKDTSRVRGGPWPSGGEDMGG